MKKPVSRSDQEAQFLAHLRALSHDTDAVADTIRIGHRPLSSEGWMAVGWQGETGEPCAEAAPTRAYERFFRAFDTND